MFAIPFNLVEDFFIVVAVANSLEAEKKSNPRLASISDFGMVSGIGWRIAQVLSFVPGLVGQAAGLLGMVLVVYHWAQITKINKLMADHEPYPKLNQHHELLIHLASKKRSGSAVSCLHV
jgi:hypothetical protein